MAEEGMGAGVPEFAPAVTADVQVGTTGESTTAGTGNDGQSTTDTTTPPGADTTVTGTTGHSDEKQESEGEKTENGETPSTDAEKEFQGIIEGWKEDRTALKSSTDENRVLRDQVDTLKAKLSRYESGYEEDETEDEYEGLSRAEREQKIFEKKQDAIKEKEESEQKAIEKEIAFHERTDPWFKSNKVAILKNADAFDATNIEQAIKITKAQHHAVERAKKLALGAEQKKREEEASQKGSGSSNVRTIENDKDLSIRDMYRLG